MNKFDYTTPVNAHLLALAVERGEELIGEAKGEYKPGRSCDYRHMKLNCGHFQDVRVVHYKKFDYTCQACFHDKLQTLAKSQGLELVSMEIVRHGNERLYRRPCGHTEIKSHNYLEKHTILSCQECMENDIHANLLKQDMRLVNRVRQGCLISCNKCTTEWVVRTDTASGGTPFCTGCFDNELQEDAIRVGFTYVKEMEPKRTVSPSRTSLSRWYSCNTCGNVDSFQHTSIKKGNTRCDKCYLTKLQGDANKQGMKYHGHVEGMFHNYELPCGCFRHIQPFSVRKGVWACKTHDDTFYHRPNGIYLIKLTLNGNSWLKLGFAKDMEIRTRGYGLPENTETEILFYKNLSTGYEAMEFEKRIHREMSGYKLNSKIMKFYMTSTGHTECYPPSLEAILLSKLKEAQVD